MKQLWIALLAWIDLRAQQEAAYAAELEINAGVLQW